MEREGEGAGNRWQLLCVCDPSPPSCLGLTQQLLLLDHHQHPTHSFHGFSDGNDFVRTDGDEDTPVIETTSALLPNCSIADHWSPLPSLVNVHTTTDHNYHPLIAAFQMIWGPVLVKLSPSRWQDAEVRTCEVLLNPEIEAGGVTVRH